jgi:hypothetical protein
VDHVCRKWLAGVVVRLAGKEKLLWHLIKLHAFLTLALDGGEWLACFPEKRTLARSYVGLDLVENYPALTDSEPGSATP